jgi:high-affinity nickel permease
MIETIAFATTGLGVGLLVSALLLGLRHGVDWDHIAAITDLSVTRSRRGAACCSGSSTRWVTVSSCW